VPIIDCPRRGTMPKIYPPAKRDVRSHGEPRKSVDFGAWLKRGVVDSRCLFAGRDKKPALTGYLARRAGTRGLIGPASRDPRRRSWAKRSCAAER
jgi:hypothetical protein